MRTRLLPTTVDLAVGLLLAAVIVGGCQRTDARKIDASRVSLSAKYAQLDSDGDGWADWYERLEGTDPSDAQSHPNAAVLEIVDERVVVQSAAFPDRLAIIDLQAADRLSTLQSAVSELLTLVQGAQTGTAVGGLRDQMIADLLQLDDSDIVAEILAQVEKDMAGSGGLEPRVGGVSAGLISDVEVGTNSGGGRSIKITDGANSKTINYWPKSGDITGYTVEYFSGPAGGTVMIETRTRNGKTEGSTVRTFDRSGALVSTQFYDAAGKPKGPPILSGGSTSSSVPSGGPATTQASGSPALSAPAGSTPVSQTPTTAGDYVNPDADVQRPPTDEELKARAEFLRGLIARFGNTLDLPTELPNNQPGVADPAEPECRDSRCVVFVVVTAPDLHRTAGGDPINPDFGPGAPPNSLP